MPQLLSSGKIIYHGPREMVLPFFEGLGFACPQRKGIAEFLQEVPTLAGERVVGQVGRGVAHPSGRVSNDIRGMGNCGRVGLGWRWVGGRGRHLEG